MSLAPRWLQRGALSRATVVKLSALALFQCNAAKGSDESTVVVSIDAAVRVKHDVAARSLFFAPWTRAVEPDEKEGEFL